MNGAGRRAVSRFVAQAAPEPHTFANDANAWPTHRAQ